MNKPQTIVVPTDFSDLSKSAFAHAAEIARAWDAEILLVHIIPPSTHPTHQVIRVKGFPNIGQQLEDAAREQLTGLASEFDDVKVNIECCEGQVANQVRRLVDTRGAELVVVATHGHGGLRHAILGSNTERILRTSSVPVLSVHSESNPPQMPLARILVPTDFSELSRTAFAAVEPYCGPDTQVILAHIHEPASYPNSPFGVVAVDLTSVTDEIRARADQELTELAEQLGDKLPNIRPMLVEGYAGDALPKIAEAESVDMIAMSTHGRTGLKHFYYGSVAERVARQAQCPVLTIAAPD